MANGTTLPTSDHLNTALVNAKFYILAELLKLTNAVTDELNLKADDKVFFAGTSGLVPAPAAGDNEKFLRGDGTWTVPVGGGGSATVIIGTASSTVEGAIWLEDDEP